MRGAGLQNVRCRAPLEIDDNGSVSEAFAPAPVVNRNGAQRFDFTLFPDMALQLPQNGVLLTAIPRRVSNRSLTRPPAAWPNSRTSSPTRCVFRSNGSAIANASVTVFRAHCSLRHRQRPERISSVAGTPPESEAPAAVASANCAVIRKLLRSPDTIDFPYPPPIRPSGSHGTGPKAKFVVFVILQIMPKQPTTKIEHGKRRRPRLDGCRH